MTPHLDSVTEIRLSTFTQYQENALRTAPRGRSLRDTILNAALGVTGEAGEVADHAKKYAFHDHALDRDAVIKEMGDVLWYLALLADALETTLDEVAARNIAKLRARYPDGFDPSRSKLRAPGDL